EPNTILYRASNQAKTFGPSKTRDPKGAFSHRGRKEFPGIAGEIKALTEARARHLWRLRASVPGKRSFAGWPSRPNFPVRWQAPVQSHGGRPRVFVVRGRSSSGPNGYRAASGQFGPHAGKRVWYRPSAPARDKR